MAQESSTGVVAGGAVGRSGVKVCAAAAAAGKKAVTKKVADAGAKKAQKPQKKAAVKKAAVTTAAKKTAAKKSVVKKAAAKAAAPAKKAAASGGAAVKRAGAGKAAAEKPAAVKKTAKKTVKKTAGKTAAKTATAAAPAKKAAAKKAAPVGKAAPVRKAAAPGSRAGAAGVPEETGVGTVAAEKAEDVLAKVPAARGKGGLAVRPGEEPWTAAEVAEARAVLEGEVSRLTGEIHTAEEAVSGLMRDSGDGAGDDQADTGTKNIAREHELALAANAREMLDQTERALGRLDTGTYGLCESCGRPIGKARMQAFPRATLCVECKQRQERR
ncbi:TraR/DksA family transcriptional regulator [Streptomyces luteireticuli]|uniref:Zinc finger DksA/TraR C4-type domain-containing protein n=1 Tax=Streptomyces luteireticuli TaxID=173858 RepID=A0ABN0YRT8_9ACTN